ncbi:hypothetical protein [Candidatus Arthromitus sp. SFB-rat-Yit]|uniref:hypothetical protein n=1 Tax=Candidatus Arthromitus sp. SFB-rat-Yit TaxID=1041504 RepID=UPI000227A577|nr:hypothetical protein [Candidatus Arthromitus sp. SFB-rat-Yit]BAK81619.1 hypothetical protein RATSFB_1057 [Candidatus Arthromitus sp. SFB-rat-Yit]
MYKQENGNVVSNDSKFLRSKTNIFQKEWLKVLVILFISVGIAIIGIINNIDKERQKVFNSMKSAIKVEVENELYSEFYDKFEPSIRVDLKKEYRNFVELELRDSLREDTLRILKHEIDNESNELFYNVFESIEYKKNGENVRHCTVVVENLDRIFEEELEGLYKQIFGNNSDKNNVLLVFSKDPEEASYRPSFRLENGVNDQILIIKDGEERNYAEGVIY